MAAGAASGSGADDSVGPASGRIWKQRDCATHAKECLCLLIRNSAHLSIAVVGSSFGDCNQATLLSKTVEHSELTRSALNGDKQNTKDDESLHDVRTAVIE